MDYRGMMEQRERQMPAIRYIIDLDKHMHTLVTHYPIGTQRVISATTAIMSNW